MNIHAFLWHPIRRPCPKNPNCWSYLIPMVASGPAVVDAGSYLCSPFLMAVHGQSCAASPQLRTPWHSRGHVIVIDNNSTDFEGAHHPAESCLHGCLDIIPKARPPIEGPRVFLTKPQSGVDCIVVSTIYLRPLSRIALQFCTPP